MPRLPLVSVFAAVLCGTAVWSADAEVKNSWPQWRGPRRDGVSSETGLLQKWTKEGPPLAWKVSGLGSGYASVVVSGGHLFTMGKRLGQDFAICLDPKDGHEIWASPVGKPAGEDPSSTPTVDGDRLYALSSNGHLVCFQAADGKELWRADYVKDFGGAVPGWKYCESPLVDGDLLIGTPGGSKATLVAFNKVTGKVVWTSLVPSEASPARDGIGGYSSPIVSNGAGVKQYVQLTGRGVVGVRASDGKFLWKYTDIINSTANIPTPIAAEDYVFASTGYGNGGTALLKLSKDGDGIKADPVYMKRARDLQNHHGGMVRLGDYVYLGHGHNNGFPTCVEWKTGRIVWGKDERGPGSGSAAILYADKQLYFRYDNGVVALIGASPNGYQLNGSFTPPNPDSPCWSHPAIADGRLYLRDQDELLVYDVRSK